MMLALFLAAAPFGCPAMLDHHAEAERPAPPKGVSGAIVGVSEDGADLRQKDGSATHVALTLGDLPEYGTHHLGAPNLPAGMAMTHRFVFAKKISSGEMRPIIPAVAA